jgi:hypothetical protein
MKNLLLKNFLSNPQLYGRAQTRWQKFLDTVAAEASSTYTVYPEAATAEDGNPLFGGYFASPDRAVRIVQIHPQDAKEYPPLIGWTDMYRPAGQSQSVPELVVFLVLAKKTERIAQSWIRNWLVEKWVPRELERKIEEESVLTVEDR